MRVPKVIKIASHDYEVFFDEAQEDGVYRGTLSNRKHLIFLNTNLHPQQLRISLLHELLHLMCEVDDIDFKESDIWRLAESLGDILFRCFGLDFEFDDIDTLERGKKAI